MPKVPSERPPAHRLENANPETRERPPQTDHHTQPRPGQALHRSDSSDAVSAIDSTAPRPQRPPTRDTTVPPEKAPVLRNRAAGHPAKEGPRAGRGRRKSPPPARAQTTAGPTAGPRTASNLPVQAEKIGRAARSTVCLTIHAPGSPDTSNAWSNTISSTATPRHTSTSRSLQGISADARAGTRPRRRSTTTDSPTWHP